MLRIINLLLKHRAKSGRNNFYEERYELMCTFGNKVAAALLLTMNVRMVGYIEWFTHPPLPLFYPSAPRVELTSSSLPLSA